MAFKQPLKVFFEKELLATLHPDVYPKPERVKKELEQLAGDRASFLRLEYTAALTFAYKKLSYKAYTSFSMEKLLKERFVSDETVSKVMQELLHRGYIDNEAFIESYFSSMIAKGYGPQKILHKLRQKDLPSSLLQPALQRYYPPALQDTQLKQVANEHSHLSPQGLQALLIRRGFYLSKVLTVSSKRV